MPHEINLQAEPRTTVGKGMGALRRSGYVPANIYGPSRQSVPIQLDAKTVKLVADRITATTMINLTVSTEPRPRTVYLQHVQWQPVKHEALHLDFYEVNLTRAMRSAVRLTFIGEAPAAKSATAALHQPVAQVHVEALPNDMPEAIEVDLSVITEIDGSIHARDLQLPPGVTLIDDPDTLIARVQKIRGAVEVPAEGAPEAAAATGEGTAPTAS
jgi:large subunit ribosomal protein L25